MKKQHLTLLLTLLLYPDVGLANETVDRSEMARVEASEHHTYRIAKLESFKSKEQWVRENYTEYLISESLQYALRENREAIAFWTLKDGIVDHHVVREADGFWVIESTDRLDQVSADLQEVFEVGLKLSSVRAAVATCDTSTNRCNCVLYARCLVPTLPFELHDYAAKKAIINANSPEVGAVAVMNVYPPYGHVGRVVSVQKDRSGKVTSVTIDEANYTKCKVTRRTGSPSKMKITGYFKP